MDRDKQGSPRGHGHIINAIPHASPRGQVVVFMALFIAVLLGVGALSIDVGYAYVQQRHMQNLADSASTAGTLVLQKNAASATDAQVKLAMLNNLSAAGMQVQWDATGTPSALVPNKVTVRAEYIYVDSSTSPATVSNSGSYVGASGSALVPSMTVGGSSKTPNGVRVDYMSINSPAFFAKVLGRQLFTVQASGAEAIVVAPAPIVGGTPTATGTATPTNTATSTGTATQTSTAMNTATSTGTATQTSTATGTATSTGTATQTGTPLPTNTALPGPCTESISVTSPLTSSNGYYATFTTFNTGDITVTWTISTSSSSGDVYSVLYRGTPTPFTGGSGLISDPSYNPSNATLQAAQVAMTDVAPSPHVAEQVNLVYPANASGNPGPGVYTVYFYNANTNKTDEVSPGTVIYPGRCGATLPNTPTPTGTATATSTATATGTATSTPTGTATNTATSTPTQTATPTSTATPMPPPAAFVPFGIWGGNPGGVQVGGDYNFWGHSWDAQVDPNSTGYDTTARFKGYIDTLPLGWDPNHPTTPSCPVGSTDPNNCWSTSPGNSSHPPGGSPPLDANGCMPQTMDVLIITDATKSGSTDYGNIAAVVEISVDNPCSYKPDPGHPMYGRVIQAVWDPNHLVHVPPTPTAGPVQVPGS